VNDLRGLSKIADRGRRAGWRYLFGQDLDTAKFTHWTTQWYPGWMVAELQWDRVRDCVSYARRASEFYRTRLRGCNIDHELTPEMFRRIPPLARSELLASWSAIRTPAAAGVGLRRRSGGSSGHSVLIPLDRATYCWYIAGTWRGLRWWGADFSDRGAIVLGTSARGLQRLAVRAKDWVMNWLRIPVTARFDGGAPAALERIAAFGPTFIYGYPSAVHRLARTAQERGWRPRGRLKVIALTGEPVYAFQRRAIQEVFQCPVAEEYGTGELGSMAFECPEGTLHATVENVYLEMPTGDVLPDGTGATLLATQLRNRLFPLIRYDTGDVGLATVEPCRCGRGLPGVRVLGRSHERLVGLGGMRLARPLVEGLCAALPERLRGRVRIAQRAPGRVELQVEAVGGSPADLT
jgi:phenylacetate-CoA ligase